MIREKKIVDKVAVYNGTTGTSIGRHEPIIEGWHSAKPVGNRFSHSALPDWIRFEDLFDLKEIQEIQDTFAVAAGVAAVITKIDGTPITQPSNFCRLCKDIILKSEVGCMNCFCSDMLLGKQEETKAQICLSGGLWGTGLGISVYRQHIANCLIGQVRDETQTEEEMRCYAGRIGVKEEVFLEAFREVPFMAKERFEKMVDFLHALVDCLSKLAYRDLLQARLIAENSQMGHLLKDYAADMELKVEERTKELSEFNQQIIILNDRLMQTNAVLEEEIERRRVQEMELFLREKQFRAMTDLLTFSDKAVDSVLKTILQGGLQLIGAPGGCIGLKEESGMTFLVGHVAGVYPERIGMSVSIETGLVGQVFKTGLVQCSANYRHYSHSLMSEDCEDISSAIAVPLTWNGIVHGVMIVSWVEQKHQITAENVAILQQYGQLASIVLGNALTYQRSEYFAFHDTLTGLANRAALKQRMDEELQRGNAQGGAVLFIDLDNLKIINDHFGHNCGDKVIVEVAIRIKTILPENSFVARVGGDEFIAILPSENRSSIASIAETLLTLLRSDYNFYGRAIKTSASIGVTLYPGDANIAEELMINADAAMYAAKAGGKNSWRFFEKSMLEDSLERLF